MANENCAQEGFDLGRMLFQMANMQKPEEPVMTMIEKRKIIALLAAYERAMLDTHARLPTVLHAAIEAFRK